MCQMDVPREGAMYDFDDGPVEVAGDPAAAAGNHADAELPNEPDATIASIDWNAGPVDLAPAKDRGILKVVLQEGTEAEGHPVEGDTVAVSYSAFYENGRMFDSRIDENNPYEFIIGKGNVVRAWDIGISSMQLNEHAVFFCHPDYAYGTDGFPPLIPGSANIIFRIQVLNWKGEDITKLKDGGIRKSVLVKGEDPLLPNDDATCTVHIRGTCDGRLFEDRTVDLVMGEGAEVGLVSGVEYALKHFKKGERSRLQVEARYAYGTTGCPESEIPPGARLCYEIEMIDFNRVKDHWEMNINERIEHSEKAKARGTEFFKAGKYNLAKKKYKQAVQYVNMKATLDENEAQKKTQLLLTGYLNLAMCQLKLDDNLSALYSCCLALEIDPTNEKGLYRRGLANMALGNLDDAVQDFTKLAELRPANKAARQQLEGAVQKKKLTRDKEKLIFGGMFRKFAEHDFKEEQQNQRGDVFSNIGEWNNEMAKDMMTLEQEMAAFGEQMPAPKYNSRKDEKENENPGSDED